ncbi:MAG: DUF882 domain-containing protein [Burkholderiaceae bacterium]|nr:DUF882 domain-containing protein [Burkholderiaceae bacterium]MEB2318436.1 DUF882 domain-containing protein [Pseudomonadota bacterium]
MTMVNDHRRRLLRGLTAGGLLLPFSTSALARVSDLGPGGPKAITMRHLHTGESLAIPSDPHVLDRRALTKVNVFLRDHYSGDIGIIDPDLIVLLAKLRRELGTDRSIHIISGFRSEATNLMLRKRGGGGVARRSMHMDGRAIDIRIPGVPLADVRDAAIDLKGGGVGFYRKSQFVHLDTGRFRTW